MTHILEWVSLAVRKEQRQGIFTGIFKFAGQLRDYNITKEEWILDGDTVLYSPARDLKTAIAYDLQQEREFNYTGLDMSGIVSHIAQFTSGL